MGRNWLYWLPSVVLSCYLICCCCCQTGIVKVLNSFECSKICYWHVLSTFHPYFIQSNLEPFFLFFTSLPSWLKQWREKLKHIKLEGKIMNIHSSDVRPNFDQIWQHYFCTYGKPNFHLGFLVLPSYLSNIPNLFIQHVIMLMFVELLLVVGHISQEFLFLCPFLQTSTSYLFMYTFRIFS